MHYDVVKSEKKVEEVGCVDRINGDQARRGEAPGVLTMSSIWKMDQVPPQLSLLRRNTEFSHLHYGFAVGQLIFNPGD